MFIVFLLGKRATRGRREASSYRCLPESQGPPGQKTTGRHPTCELLPLDWSLTRILPSSAAIGARNYMSTAGSPLRRSPRRDASARSGFPSTSTGTGRILKLYDEGEGSVFNEEDADKGGNRKSVSE